MNKITKIVALFMALVLCLSFAACGGKDDEGASAVNKDDLVAMGEETVAGENEEADFVIATNPPAEATTADGEATTVAGEVTTVAGETTTAAPSDKPTQPVIVMPQTTAEVVAYFNKSVDNVKANAKTVKQEYVVNYLAASATVPSVLNGVFKMLGGDEWLDKMLADNSKGAETFSTKEAIKAGFPVENQTWASKLTADDVKSAKCELKGKIFVITIETKPDGKSSTIDYGQGHAPKALNAVPPRVINDNIPKPAQGITGTASMAYPYGKVVIKVDPITGNVLTAEYDVQWTINFDKAGAIIPLGTRSSYTVTF